MRITRSPRPWHATAGIGAAMLLGTAALSGCAGTSASGTAAQRPATTRPAAVTTVSPGQRELAEAARALRRGHVVTTTIALGASAATVRSVAAHDFDESLTAAQANALSTGVVTIERLAPHGRAVGNRIRRDRLRVDIASQGVHYLDLEVVHRIGYLRLDVVGLAGLAGATVPAGLSATPGMPSFVRALLADKWVSLPLRDVRPLLKLVTGQRMKLAGHRRQLRRALLGVLVKDLTVTRTSSNLGTDQLAVSANARTLATGLLAVLAPAFANRVTNLSDIPNRTVTALATVKGGVLRELEANVAQLGSSSSPRLPLDIHFDQGGGAIAVPKHASRVKIRRLGSLLSLLAGGGL